MNLGLSELLFLAAILALSAFGKSFAKFGIKYLEVKKLKAKQDKEEETKKLLP